ncbi:MAG TPA: VOC family protein [Ilumatobacteraceae bacterium]|nr:VOC family protein [Ilumatobacteraceae bacterium]
MYVTSHVQGIHHVGLLVDDLDATLPFYTEVLGIPRNRDRPDFAVRGAWLDLNDRQQLHVFEGPTPADGGQHVALQVTDLDGLIERLTSLGVKVRGFPREGPFTQAVVFDPAGNRVELYAGPSA